MLQVVNRIDECLTGREKPLSYDRLTYVVIHRTSLARKGPDNPSPVPDSLLDGPALAKAFRDNWKDPPDGLGTGGRCPYHFLIRTGGTCEQLLPLSVRGTHAVSYNPISLAVAVAGDFRFKEPSPAQWRSLTDVVAALCVYKRNGLHIVGHTQVPDSSHDERKECPGDNLSMSDLLGRVRSTIQDTTPQWRGWTPDEARHHLIAKGVHV